MLLHLITICIGLIIAFGLQQIVESWRRRHRIRKARAADLEAHKPPTGETTPPPPEPPADPIL